MSSLDVLGVLAATAEQAVAAAADYGIVVQRRDGKSDPGAWWAWLPVGDIASLIDAARNPDVLQLADPTLAMPARMELGDLVPLLRRAGYGEGT